MALAVVASGAFIFFVGRSKRLLEYLEVFMTVLALRSMLELTMVAFLANNLTGLCCRPRSDRPIRRLMTN